MNPADHPAEIARLEKLGDPSRLEGLAAVDGRHAERL